MSIDRYTRIALTIIALSLTVIAVRPWLPAPGMMTVLTPTAAHAQGAKYEITVPKEWGKLVAFSNNNLLLEATDHSRRIVDVEGKAPEFPRVKVLVRFQ